MLKDYFSQHTSEQERRLLAVEAALEIAKASVSASTSYSGIKSQADLKNVAAEISNLADAIQEALEGDEEK